MQKDLCLLLQLTVGALATATAKIAHFMAGTGNASMTTTETDI